MVAYRGAGDRGCKIAKSRGRKMGAKETQNFNHLNTEINTAHQGGRHVENAMKVGGINGENVQS